VEGGGGADAAGSRLNERRTMKSAASTSATLCSPQTAAASPRGAVL